MDDEKRKSMTKVAQNTVNLDVTRSTFNLLSEGGGFVQLIASLLQERVNLRRRRSMSLSTQTFIHIWGRF